MNSETPRQRRKAKNFDHILEVTARLIGEKGIENVSLRDVAKAADYSPGALYKYFDGKAAIFKNLLTRENSKLLEGLAGIPSNLPVQEQLVIACLQYVAFSLENPAYPVLINTLITDRTTSSDPIPDKSPYQFFLTLVIKWVRDHKIAVSQSYGPEEITYALWTMIHGMAALRLNQLKNFEADFDAANRKTLETFLRGLQR